MAKTSNFEIPSSMRQMAGQGVEQAQDAFNRFREAMRDAQSAINQSADAMSSGAKELQEKTLNYVESNMQANFKLAEELVKAGDLKEALDIQSKFAQQQMESYAQQAQEISGLIMESAQKSRPNSK